MRPHSYLRFLLAPIVLATWLWNWAAPAIPDPGLRYVGLFILPQAAANHVAGMVVSVIGTTGGGLASCLTALFCCVCLPVIFFVGSDPKTEWDLIPEFGPRPDPPSR